MKEIYVIKFDEYAPVYCDNLVLIKKVELNKRVQKLVEGRRG